MGRGGKVKCSYQLKQDHLCVDWVRDIIVVSIYFRCDDLGMIADDLGHADLHADSMPVIDSSCAETEGWVVSYQRLGSIRWPTTWKVCKHRTRTERDTPRIKCNQDHLQG